MAALGALPLPAASEQGITIEIGGIPVRFATSDAAFCALLAKRYAGFVNPAAEPACHFDVQIVNPSIGSDQDAEVTRHGHLWHIDRGDFHAEFDPVARRGTVQQSCNPYAADTLLRITHSLVLAEEGGLLIHSASAFRNGSAFLFAGVSGAGKTTISRFAPSDAAVLTDEISYLRRVGDEYRAFGTPFAGELARVGENLSAPLKTLFLLQQGSVHRIDPVDRATAAREILRHILFFAHDENLVRRVFDAALDLVDRVPVCRLTFRRDAGVWELIQ